MDQNTVATKPKEEAQDSMFFNFQVHRTCPVNGDSCVCTTEKCPYYSDEEQ